MHHDALLDLIDGIYASALDPAGWPDVLRSLADGLGAREASLGILAVNATPWIIAPRTDPAFALTYQQHYHPLNLFWRQVTRQPIGQVATDAMLLERDHLHGSEFFNDWSAPQGYRTVMGVTLDQSANGRIELQIPGSREFEQDQVAIVTRLVPHLTRSSQIMQLLATTRSHKEGLFTALDHLEQGVLVLDDRLQLTHANTSAERHLSAGLGRNGSIVAKVAGEDRKLQALLSCCLGSTLSPGGTIRLTREDQPPLALAITPLPVAHSAFALPKGRVLVIITDPLAGRSEQLQRLRHRFGLTAAELALLLEIAKGDGREAAAQRRGITIATARSQLTSIFDKTGVRRQAELVRLLHE